VSGQAGSFAQPYSGVAEALVTGGVPNVMGFRWAVSDTGALEFASEFYRYLFEVQAEEKNLALAALHARRNTEARAGCFDAWASSLLVTQVL
jgi:CHAT domain-containing protein